MLSTEVRPAKRTTDPAKDAALPLRVGDERRRTCRRDSTNRGQRGRQQLVIVVHYADPVVRPRAEAIVPIPHHAESDVVAVNVNARNILQGRCRAVG